MTIRFHALCGAIFLLLFLLPRNVAAQTSPDTFGYKLVSGNSLYDFEDISSGPNQGATLPDLNQDDSFSEAVSIGFPFRFYENEYTGCFINTNGSVSFEQGWSATTPGTIPSAGGPRNFIAGFHADLDPRVGTGEIYFTTLGIAPNRRFIIQWNAVRYYLGPAGANTFQIQLHEGSNIIEKHYQTLVLDDDAGSFGIGIENKAGTIGISYAAGQSNDLTNDLPLFATPFVPFGLRYERPVVIQVKSDLPVGTPITPGAPKEIGAGSVVLLGTGTKDSNENFTYPGANVNFEAPEFIYFDAAGTELPDIGELDGAEAQKAYYRARNLGYAIVGQEIQGTDLFFEETLREDITVIWKWELEYAVFIESETTTGVSLPAPDQADGIGNPLPVVGRTFLPKDTLFSASVDRTVGNDTLGLDISGRRFSAESYSLSDAGGDASASGNPVALGDTGNRVVTESITITDWLRVKWQWNGQVRYRFYATGDAAEGSARFAGQSFLRVYEDDPDTTGVNEAITGKLFHGLAPFNEQWINLDTRVEVGAFYRTADRCLTLLDFPSVPSGDLGGMGTDISVLTDITESPFVGLSRTARTFNVPSVRAPSEINWVYQPTVFRAEIPLGSFFDPTAPNPVLVPDLCDGAELSLNGPAAGFLLSVGTPPPGIRIGDPLRWDQVSEKLHPVHPGSYQISWPDEDIPGREYRIEVVSTYPNTEIELASEREKDSGLRITPAEAGVAPYLNHRVTTEPDDLATPDVDERLTTRRDYVTLAGTSAPFPAAPDAHYVHLIDPVASRRPPTKLDVDTTDEWTLQELTYSDEDTEGSADAAGPGKPFNTKGRGRSVLLFSYRPNPDEVADGNLSKEALSVRVVNSVEATRSPAPNDLGTILGPLLPDDTDLVLGRRALEFGNGALGVVLRTNPDRTINPGTNFVIDYWLNASGAQASDEPVTILATGGDKLTVTLDAENAALTVRYLGTEANPGITVTHPFTTGGTTWKHHIIHAFTDSFFGIQATFLDFYVDGVREEQAMITGALPFSAPASSDVDPGLTSQSLRLGVGADPLSRLQLDEFRLYDNLPSRDAPWLTPTELTELRSVRAAVVNTRSPLVQFSFEQAPSNGSLPPNAGTSYQNIGIGPVADDPNPDPELRYVGIWAHSDIQEVATRLDGVLDQAGFGGSGYIQNPISNYNADLYDRDAEVGTWGPIFPVNQTNLLYTDPLRRLEVAYYQNLYLLDPQENPNVAWPYRNAVYNEVKYPKHGPHKDKAIYIASRVGSEGVDRNGRVQEIFDLAEFSDLKIYNQDDRSAPGFNPNEEHALVAASSRAGLKMKNLGADIPNNPPLAAYALQRDINALSPSFTSDPWVLVQVNNLATEEPEMAAYEVSKFRVGTIPFPRPSDQTVNATEGLAYESAPQPENRFLTIDPDKTYQFSYAFGYPVFAGDLLIPPYPLNLVVGNVAMTDDRGSNDGSQQTLWRDVNGHAWIVSGDLAGEPGRFLHRFHYPFRGDFYYPSAINPGTPVAWVPEEINGTRRFVGDNLVPHPVIYSSFWRTSYPKLKRGETLTYQGGEYFNENPGSNGLPALVAMSAAEIVFDSGTPTMILGEADLPNQSARIIRPLDRHESVFTVAQMAAAGFSPAATSISVIAERWYFKDLPGSLQKRFYFDSLAEKLVFRGYLNEKDSGDADLTAGPDPINILEPNVVTADELKRLESLSEDGDWTTAITLIHQKSQNPMRTRRETVQGGSEITGKYLAGVKEAPTLTQRIGLNAQLFSAGQDLAAEEDKLQVLVDRIEELEDRKRITWSTSTYVSLEGQISVVEDQIDSFDERRIRNLEQEVGNYEIQIDDLPSPEVSAFSNLDSFGVGSALVCNPNLLTSPVEGSRYVTIVENNRSELEGAPVSLHIVEIVPDRFRGAIKVIEGADAFSEKITLQHNGDFGANTGDLYYEWWIRDAAPLDLVANEVLADGSLKEFDDRGNSLWQQYIPQERNSLPTEAAKHLGLHTIVFEGRPDVTLADKLVLMRYRHRTEEGWNLVPFEFTNPGAEWRPGNPAPFQWAGAANSPQLQADGSKRYIPQLVMGWIKRILDRINPYEARYNDFFSNESPATYSSQIQIAGAPFAGKVALNPDKNVIENTGLIELYETVLARARELSIDNSSNPVATDGINQALLLAATRLAVLYELLAREAYSDAQDSTITVTDVDDLSSVASFTHAFQNFEPDLLHEELSLLRGTDFRKSFPVYNRMFWNYAKGLGEAAYNVNYNIYDENTDGFINEEDGRALYPQGHGDAWGHFLSSLGMHYTLLQHPVFSWKTRSELYSLMQNVLEVDFLDEKTFAKLAAGKARAGRDIVRGTYRINYTQDPAGQWQGYTDGVNKARAWGVSEWAHRAGQGAYFDWAVANALLPEEAAAATPVENPENLDRIERLGSIDEIGEIAAGLYEIQTAMDEANSGANPLGFDSDAIAFDLDPTNLTVASAIQGETHFEQIYLRAVAAGNNAVATLDYASKIGNKLHRIADDTDALIVEAFRQDLDYRNRLIEIFGRPYDGTIGFGKVYPEGYEGPDTQLFGYLDHTSITQIIPETAADAPAQLVTFQSLSNRILGISDDRNTEKIFADIYGNAFTNIGAAIANPFGGTAGVGSSQLREAFVTLLESRTYEDFSTTVRELELPVRRNSPYAFQAPPDWGQRTSYGKVQRILEEDLQERVALDSTINQYIAYLQDFEFKIKQLATEIEFVNRRDNIDIQITGLRKLQEALRVAKDAAIAVALTIEETVEDTAEGGSEALPTSVGFSTDVASPARGGILLISIIAQTAAEATATTLEQVRKAAAFLTGVLITDLERDKEKTGELAAIEALIADLINLSGNDAPSRAAIGIHLQNLELKRQEFISAQAEGFRLLREREGFNKILAAKVQKNRYQDMMFRIARNEAMSKYQGSFEHAARYAWLTVRAYDYETSLGEGHPASPGPLYDRIVKERQLGLWTDGEPQAGKGGLAEILSHLDDNFQTLESQLGINSLQIANENISMRAEKFRIGATFANGGTVESDTRWKEALLARKVDDLWQVPEFVRHCRPFASRSAGAQPGIVLRFSTTIEAGKNFFGEPLAAGDHAYSSSQFATRIGTAGVFLDGYPDSGANGLATTPRAYLIPVGTDYMRISTDNDAQIRMWSVHDTRIPTPFVLNAGNLTAPGFIPSVDGLDGAFGDPRRHADFRMYHLGESDLIDAEQSSRLVGRSIWNSDWLLVIPGAGLHADANFGLTQFANAVSDIKLTFKTYSHNGQ